jgi:ABC-type antimicrobial peptide transport system permease subunit
MGPVRQAASAVDPGEVIYAVETMHGVIENAFAARRLSMILLAFFAAIALALSCIGIYGVISYLVGERTREIGVRMALGAQRGDVLRLILRQGATMALVGVALGIGLALGLTRLISAQLFGVTAHDPLTFAAVGLVLIVVALVACWLPARRAASVDPIVALHAE